MTSAYLLCTCCYNILYFVTIENLVLIYIQRKKMKRVFFDDVTWLIRVALTLELQKCYILEYSVLIIRFDEILRYSLDTLNLIKCIVYRHYKSMHKIEGNVQQNIILFKEWWYNFSSSIYLLKLQFVYVCFLTKTIFGTSHIRVNFVWIGKSR